MRAPNSRRNLDIAIQLYRNQKPWPPVVVTGDTWAGAYEAQRRNLDAIEGVEDAVAWANNSIGQIALTSA